MRDIEEAPPADVRARRRARAVGWTVAAAVAALALPTAVTMAGSGPPDAAVATSGRGPSTADVTPIGSRSPTIAVAPPGTAPPTADLTPTATLPPERPATRGMIRGVPTFLRQTTIPRDLSRQLSPAESTVYYTGGAGAPVDGLVVLHNPAGTAGLPGVVVDLPVGLVQDGSLMLATDDAAGGRAHLHAWRPTGGEEYLVVHGGDPRARRSVLEAIVAASFG
ncbi:hypothetical protein O7635_31550 [Asanoa sp. WMMD1127]|uniref:hypothetical protein n=1 Tax=Asanoa sp. WMMD1127 TaxID=3016107 RepID=UPI00241632A0|nr:hypothetical protein [Asanoa sp. WMMD1127]MDG4826409.1 hypothetical protein [Asanoa sp. WMMD1127]